MFERGTQPHLRIREIIWYLSIVLVIFYSKYFIIIVPFSLLCLFTFRIDLMLYDTSESKLGVAEVVLEAPKLLEVPW